MFPHDLVEWHTIVWVSAEPRNSATDRLAIHVAELHRTADLPRSLYTEDFMSEDRRRVIGAPTADLEDFARNRAVNKELGAVRGLTRRLLAVAGDRCCCVEHLSMYARGEEIEAIHVLQFDQSIERLRRLVIFDVDELDDALAELHRLHAETTAADC